MNLFWRCTIDLYHYYYYSYFAYSLLEMKRTEIGNQANKLKSGLSKLIETREKVQAMSIELEEAKVKVAEYQKQCDEYLVIIVQQKRDAEEQEKVKHNCIVE